MKVRNTLLVVLCIAATIGVILLVTYGYSTGLIPGMLYRHTGGGGWLYSTLYHGVRNGSTKEQVERLLGPGQEASANVHEAVMKFAGSNASAYPDGYEEGDELLGFRLPGGELYLQFRRGVLVNFNPDEFEKYEEAKVVGL